MESLYNCGKLEVKTSTIPDSGFGVFATEDIEKGEILEECQYVMFPNNDCTKNIIRDYRFYMGKDKDSFAVVLGYASLYNSDPLKRNAIWATPSMGKKVLFEPTSLKLEKNYLNCFTFFAVNDIKKGEEIFTDYHSSYQKK